MVCLGDLVLDVTTRAAAPLAEGTDTLGEVRASPGGSAANVAAWLAHLGCRVTMIGRVGRDLVGELLVRDLILRGIAAHVARDPERPSGIIAVQVDARGERSMVISPAANHALDEEDVLEAAFEGAQHLHLTAYSLFWPDPRRAAKKALVLARARGLSVSLDPSSVGLLRMRPPKAMWDDVPRPDIFFPNLDEGRLLTGSDEPEEILRRLAGLVGLAVLKLGARGAALLEEGRLRHFAAPGLEDPLDTTGAGDSFAAGFLAAWLGGQPAAAAVEAGIAQAAVCCRQPGARPPAPGRNLGASRQRLSKPPV